MSPSVQIPFLSNGDLVYITAPAKSIEQEAVDYAKRVFEERGYRVKISDHCTGIHHYFSGTQEARIRDLQAGIDDPEVKAIVCARGGYGCVQIMDSVKWAGMLTQPKWLVGFSDVTFFHQHLQFLGLPSLHATMPLNYATNSVASLQTMFSAMEGKHYSIQSAPHSYNRFGKVTGKLIGGNLSILYSMLGAKDRPDYSGSILFIEDLCEYIYHIDRMLQAFRRSGILENISGLIVGGMTEMNDTAVPFGQLVENVILDHFQFRKLPVCFGFPAGHIEDNRALVLGAITTLSVDEKGGMVSFHTNA